MAWVELRKGDFLNLDYVMVLHAEFSPVEDEEWVIAAVLNPGDSVQLNGSWPTQEEAKKWIRGILLGAGEKIAGHVILR